jgi:Uma2 family endonuclease
MDETTKRVAYMQIETLQEYVLVEQDIVDIEVVRRSHGWLPEHYYLGDEITLASINLTISVEEIYDRIQNADIIEWLQAQVKTE